MGAVLMIDMDGDLMLAKLSKELAAKDVRIFLVNVGENLQKLLRTTGTLDLIGPQNIYRTVRGAVDAARAGATHEKG
jgi:anti-anti-sigma regulatory factor